MTKKSALFISIFIVIVSISGSLLYRNHLIQEKNDEILKKNQKLIFKIKANQKEQYYLEEQKAAQAKRDSAFEVEKKKREAQIKQIQEALKKLEEEAKKQQ